MSRPHENALTPASLATDGNQGEGAKALGPCDSQHSPLASQARAGVLSAVHAALEHLARYAHATDAPAADMVDAADLLDAAVECLVPAVVSHGIARAREPEA